MIRLSHHATYAVCLEGWRVDRAIVKVLGAELGDKPIFDVAKPISAVLVQRAAQLAAHAGVRVPSIYDVGDLRRVCDGSEEAFQFVIQQFIEHSANAAKGLPTVVPETEVTTAATRVIAKLSARPIATDADEPLPWFATRAKFLASLRDLTMDHRVHQILAVRARHAIRECCTVHVARLSSCEVPRAACSATCIACMLHAALFLAARLMLRVVVLHARQNRAGARPESGIPLAMRVWNKHSWATIRPS
jgi:hypothetical protein